MVVKELQQGKMILRGLDDNISLLRGLSGSDACNQGGGSPCFQLSANEKCYDISIIKHPLYWALLTGYLYDETQLGQTWDDRRDYWKNLLSHIFIEEKLPIYLEETNGRRIYYANDSTITDPKVLIELHVKDGKLDLTRINPEIINIAMGSVLTDKFGNSYFGSMFGYGNPISRAMLQDGYFGKYQTNGNKAGGVNRLAVRRDDDANYQFEILNNSNFDANHIYQIHFDFWVENSPNKSMLKYICKSGGQPCIDFYNGVLGTRDKVAKNGKFDKPVALLINRTNGELKSFGNYATALLPVLGATLVLTGVGAVFAGGLVALASKAVSTKGKINLMDAVDSGIGEALLPKGSPVTGMLPLAKKYAKNDWAGLAKDGLGLVGVSDSTIKPYLESNNIMKLLSVSKGKSFDELSKLAQNYNNLNLPSNITNTLKSGMTAQQLVESGDVAQTAKLVQLFTTASSGGFTPAIPTKGMEYNSDKIQQLIPLMLNEDTKHFGMNTDPNRRNQLMRMANGFSVSKNAFDDIVIEGLQNKMSLGDGLSDNNEIVLPAGLPLDKRECFAKWLKCKGFTVIVGSENQAKEELANPTKPRTTAGKTGNTMITVKKEWK